MSGALEREHGGAGQTPLPRSREPRRIHAARVSATLRAMAGDRAELAIAAWDDATAALARGDSATFLEQSRRAVIEAAAAGDVAGARELADVRDRVLLQATAADPSAALAEVLASIADGSAEDVALAWQLGRALAGELPALHPLAAAANELQWGARAADVMLAVLAIGGQSDPAMIATLVGATREDVAPEIDALLAQGALVARDGVLTAAPILAAACAGRASTLALPPAASQFPSETFATDVFRAAGVVVAIAPDPAVAVASLRAARLPALAAPPTALHDPVARGWIVREACWQTAPLVVELEHPIDPALLALAASVPRAIVIPSTPDDVTPALDGLGALGASVRTWESVAIAPADAATVLAGALGVPAAAVRVGHLYAADIDELVAAIPQRGEGALAALAHELQRRAFVDLSPFVYGAAPDVPSGVLDRARELLATDGAFGARIAALVAPLPLAAAIALALAGDRGVVAATLALGAADADARMQRALAAARRWGAVLCVGIDRATPAVLDAFARQLAASNVEVVIGVRPGTPLPHTLSALAAKLMV